MDWFFGQIDFGLLTKTGDLVKHFSPKSVEIGVLIYTIFPFFCCVGIVTASIGTGQIELVYLHWEMNGDLARDRATRKTQLP